MRRPLRAALLRHAAGVLLLVCALPAVTFADEQTAGVRTVPRQHIGIRAYFLYDRSDLAASDTFKGVVGTSRLYSKGIGAEGLGLWRGAFARVAFSNMEHAGSRIAVTNGEATSLNIPLTVKMSPLEVAGGWRLHARRLPPRVGPYAGGGLLRLTYRETSDFADTGEDVSTVFNGYLMFAGVDVTIVPWVVAGVEAQYRSLPNAIGQGGASAAYGESNLGGTTLRVVIGIKR